ncbi:Hypothetical_protein [Hexamita inflata]|uniref:Hypothetical_protein n=1 Tax=Hexamita inflata TaxID=28002 RepID=A0AA86P6A8_9EUKA|nr:Hypothetical protein HINF_LOCUS19166 [Hexamita inflata]
MSRRRESSCYFNIWMCIQVIKIQEIIVAAAEYAYSYQQPKYFTIEIRLQYEFLHFHNTDFHLWMSKVKRHKRWLSIQLVFCFYFNPLFQFSKTFFCLTCDNATRDICLERNAVVFLLIIVQKGKEM